MRSEESHNESHAHKHHPHVSNKLTEYVMSMLAQGYHVSTIKEELKKAGHHNDIIDEVVTKVLDYKEQIQQKEVEDQKEVAEQDKEETKELYDKVMSQAYEGGSSSEKTFAAFYFIGLFILIIWVSISTMAPVINIFISFLPAVLSIITIFALFDTFEKNFRWGMFIVPFVWCGLFYYLGIAGILPMYAVLDIGNITVLNFLLSLVFVVIIYLIGEVENRLVTYEKSRIVKKKLMNDMLAKKERIHHHKAEQKKTEKEHHAKNIEEAPKVITEYIQSIEDKSKAMNFVIGRVYSQRNGGTPEMRDKIKINSEWYNEFSEVTGDNVNEKLFAAQKTVYLIYERLLDLKRSEKEIFGKISYELKNLKRDEFGRTKIIDVLNDNDKDPVDVYYKSSLEFCTKAINELKRFKIELPKDENKED